MAMAWKGGCGEEASLGLILFLWLSGLGAVFFGVFRCLVEALQVCKCGKTDDRGCCGFVPWWS